MIARYPTFTAAIDACTSLVRDYGEVVDTGHWQGVATEGRPDLQTKELLNVAFTCPMPKSTHEGAIDELADEIQPNLPWADDHFAERVGRVPTNPGEAYRSWPWWHESKTMTTAAEDETFKFTHTYQERYWPKRAGEMKIRTDFPHHGIRYDYGDLDDVVNQLQRYPYGRQAYFPIFFPEDTGNVHGGRVPCTLGYHFMLRGDQLHMWYFIRSCDLVRHFRDDLYLSARLLLWVLDELKERTAPADSVGFWCDITPGNFTFVCPSLHYHKGDEHHLTS